MFCVIGIGGESSGGSVMMPKQRLWREYRVVLQGGLFGLVLLGSRLGTGRCGCGSFQFTAIMVVVGCVFVVVCG